MTMIPKFLFAILVAILLTGCDYRYIMEYNWGKIHLDNKQQITFITFFIKPDDTVLHLCTQSEKYLIGENTTVKDLEAFFKRNCLEYCVEKYREYKYSERRIEEKILISSGDIFFYFTNKLENVKVVYNNKNSARKSLSITFKNKNIPQKNQINNALDVFGENYEIKRFIIK